MTGVTFDQRIEHDGYSDEDLDALPLNTFKKLPEEAYFSTQSLDNAESRNPESIERLGSIGDLSAGLDVTLSKKGPHQPSSDYGDLDDEMLDGEIFDGAEQPTANEHAPAAIQLGQSTQREHWRQQRYSVPSQHALTQHQLARSPRTNSGWSPRPAPIGPATASPPATEHSVVEQMTDLASADVRFLRAQVQSLLRERETLKEEVLHANNTCVAKAGEIAIVRAKIVKAEQEIDFRTKVQQRLQADEYARHKAEIDRARAEIQSITTEKAFLENEIAEGSKQLRQVKKAMKKDIPSETKGHLKQASPVTPRKSKSISYADGFNDDEIQILSPPQLVHRGKTGTPKTGAKRKRKIGEESPVQFQQLELAGSVSLGKMEHAANNQPVIGIQYEKQPNANLQFTRRLLDHKFERNQERTIEALCRFKLPSQPTKSLSALLYDQLLIVGEGTKIKNLPAAVGLNVISIWSECLKERYQSPIHLLIDLLEFILLITPLKTAPELTDSLMQVVQETADIVVIPRCQKKPPPLESCRITSLACLRVIQMVALDCSADEKEISRFWRAMRFDFTMMLLSFLHPLEEIHIAVAILRTSIFRNSFAMIIPQGDGKQDASEAHVIDNLTRLLVESPRSTQGEPVLDAVQICELRLEILGVLDGMCERQYCAEALAKHRLVIGRLVRVMNDELDKAYDYAHGHGQRIALVNAATHLLFVLTSKYAPLIDMQARLSVIPGGEKKYLIALTRLAFSEGAFSESGIKDEATSEAHQMLEMRVSPEEADQLVGAFASTQNSRRISRDFT